MMNSAYKITDNASIREIKEGITTLEEAATFIVELAANYSVALELLSENGIRHRIDGSITDRGLLVLAGIHDISTYMAGLLEEENGRNGQ